jgi:hypothetical protein
VILFFALMALMCVVQAARFTHQWARPRGALYPARHFLAPVAVLLLLAGLCVWMAVTLP